MAELIDEPGAGGPEGHVVMGSGLTLHFLFLRSLWSFSNSQKLIRAEHFDDKNECSRHGGKSKNFTGTWLRQLQIKSQASILSSD